MPTYEDLRAENQIRPSGMGAVEYRLRLQAEMENMRRGDPTPLMRLNLCAEDARRAKDDLVTALREQIAATELALYGRPCDEAEITARSDRSRAVLAKVDAQ